MTDLAVEVGVQKFSCIVPQDTAVNAVRVGACGSDTVGIVDSSSVVDVEVFGN